MLKIFVASIAVSLTLLPTLAHAQRDSTRYVTVTVGATRTSARQRDFSRPTVPIFSAVLGNVRRNGQGSEWRLSAFHLTSHQQPGIAQPETLYTVGLTTLVLESATMYRSRASRNARVRPYASVGLAIAMIRDTYHSDTPGETKFALRAGPIAAIGVDASLNSRVGFITRASYRLFEFGTRRPALSLTLNGPAIEMGVRVNR